ncbi:MAG: nucleoside diphosphate kinase regulator [Cytophagaceae bacterium]|nr:MAG: nucleoside diphosphate kinase regulator [Cytophagaceae bacterium]
MTTKPKIIISSADFDKLEALLDSMPGTASPHKTALLNEIARADILEPHEMPPSIVTMNSTVEFSMEGAAHDFRLTLVYPTEVQDTPDCISILAPVGSALLGLAIGDSMEWPRPGGGLIKVRIKNVLYQPERNVNFSA